MAAVKNEIHHWPAGSSIFPQSSPSSSHFVMNSNNLWVQQSPQQQQQQQQTPPPPLHSFSPQLSDYFMMQPEEDILSMSSLDSSFQSGLTTDNMEEEDDDQTGTPFFSAAVAAAAGFSSSSSYSSSSNNNHNSMLLPSSPPANSSYAPQLSPNQNNILLESVMKSKLENIETVLLGEDEVPDDDSSTESPSHAQIHLQQPQQHEEQQKIMPPPPPLQRFVQPTQESLGTIRSFDFQVQPTFATWASYSSPAVVPHAAWQHQQSVIAHRQQQQTASSLQPAGWGPQHDALIPPAVYHTEDPQVMLVHMLVRCAHAVADEDYRTINVILVGLRQYTSPSGTPMERLATYFAEALAARTDHRTDVRTASSSLFRGLVSDKLLESDGSTQASMLEAFSTFYDYLPIGKFDHLTMNQVILDTVEKDRAIHILDLQLWFGTQWPALLQALATRPGGPPRVRITAVGTSTHDLEATGRKLEECAKTLRVQLHYHQLLLTNLAEQFHAGLVELRPGETFIVNSLSQFHYLLGAEEVSSTSTGISTISSDDRSSSAAGGSNKSSESKFANFMKQIRLLRPKVVVMAENDASHNSPEFLKRFGECLKYYSAVFDAMATCSSSPTGRLKMERLFAAPKIRNIIACEGKDRVERHESMADWSKRLSSAGFRALPLSQRAINQAKLLLRLYYTNGYTLHSDCGHLVLGWRNLPLNTVSAWRLG